MTIVVRQGRIERIAPSSAAPPPAGLPVVDGTEKFVIPGLWDMHVHLFNHTRPAPPDDHITFPVFVAHGVTSVREMWTKPQEAPQIRSWRAQLAQGRMGPRLIAVGTVVDGAPPLVPGALVATTEAEAVAAVATIQAAGIDFVKVYWNLQRAPFLAIAEEARRRGMRVAGHVPYLVKPSEASDAGMASIEHLTEIPMECSSKEAELRAIDPAKWSAAEDAIMWGTRDPRKCGELAAKLAANRTWQVPTLVMHRTLSFDYDESIVTQDALRWVPAAKRRAWFTEREKVRKGSSPEIRAMMRTAFRAHLALLKQLHRAGVPILAGSDVGMPFVFPGDSLHDELALLVEAGLTPMEALRSATQSPARFSEMDRELGTVEVGKLADLVVLDANPLEDIRNTRRIDAVVLRGRLLSRASLQHALADAESAARR